MINQIIKLGLFTFLLLTMSTTQSFSQEDINSLITKLDTEFWDAYNRCDVPNMSKFMTDDVEFYHDIHGLTSTKVAMVATLRDGLCGGSQKVRREAAEGTINIYPLKSFGAVISGDHYFYLTENGNPERLTGVAKFTHIWKEEADGWKMSRVISYDHKEASVKMEKPAVALTVDQLNLLSGKYRAPNTGLVEITVKEGHLFLTAEGMESDIYPEGDLLFFHREVPLKFEFVKGTDGKIAKFIVIENGNPVEEAVRVD